MRMQRRIAKRRRGVAAFATMALVLVACGGAEEGTATDEEAAGEEAAVEETAVEETAVEEAAVEETAGEEAAGEEGSDWEEVLTAAEEEGEAVFAGTQVEAWTEAMVPVFQEETGLNMVVAPRAASSAIMERFSAEVEAGNVGSDVFWVADHSIWVANPDWFVNLEEAGIPNFEDYPDEAKWPTPGEDVRCIDMAGDTAGLAYNHDLVPEDQVPETWEDILDPYWEGKVALTDPRASPTYNAWAYTMLEEYGVEFLEGVAAHQPDLFDSASPAGEQVAAGAYEISYMSHDPNTAELRAQGAPLTYVIPEGPTFGHFACTGIPADAPHPNAAKVMMNWLMSPEAHSAGCDSLPQVSPLEGTTCPEAPDFWSPSPLDPETGQFIGQADMGTPDHATVLEPLGIE